MKNPTAPRPERRHAFRSLVPALLLICGAGAVFCHAASAQNAPQWKTHDPYRPHPRVVTPAPVDKPVPPPSDAVVLFNGTDLAGWCGEDGSPPTWILQEGTMIPQGKGDDIFTRRTFGDVQLHVEWAAPIPAKGQGQGRGNSGIFLMGLYEVQILDSFENETYADGQAAAIYGQHPPLVNACRPPGEWQTYDIVFRRPRFCADGTLSQPARMTVFHNGIIVQENAAFRGPTTWLQHMPYNLHPDRMPISIQDHSNPVRFRNIWARELAETTEPPPPPGKPLPVFHLTPEALEQYVGRYRFSPAYPASYEIRSDGRQLHCIYGKKRSRVDLVAHSPEKFSLRWTAGQVEFVLDESGKAKVMILIVPGARVTLQRAE